MRPKNERTDKFLEELTELTKKHGIEICGCGCCDSPWLNYMIGNEDLGGNLYFDEDKQKYICD